MASTLAQVLVAGNTTSGKNILVSSADAINFVSGVSIGGNNTATGTSPGTCVCIGSGASGSDNAVSIGNGSTSSGTHCCAIGQSAQATAVGATAYGVQANAGGTDSTAIGYSAQTASTAGSSFGYNATNGGSSATNSTSLGTGASNANFANATCLGVSSTNTAAHQVMLGTSSEVVQIPGSMIFTNGVVIGGANQAATSTGAGSIAIGKQATCAATSSSIAIGSNASSTTNSVAFGASANSSANGTTSVGYSAASSGTQSTAVGDNASCSGANSTALGSSASDGSFASSVALGSGATCTATNQIMLGTSSQVVVCPSDIQVHQHFVTTQGGGLTVASTTNCTVSAITNTNNTDIAGNMTINVSGAGQWSATINFAKSYPSSTGTIVVIPVGTSIAGWNACGGAAYFASSSSFTVSSSYPATGTLTLGCVYLVLGH
jgi:trimeric autotransporter adhesin